MGFIDVLELVDDKVVRVMDYKTSGKDAITPEYELQLAIYALLVHETYGYPPEEVAIQFLKFGERNVKVHPELLDLAKKECAFVTEKTQSEDIKDYPKKVTPLCKWENARGSGQCDFYDVCFGPQQELL
jgi:CRISPR/Cas system-associated exonuclease Cas4 (RecB family)